MINVIRTHVSILVRSSGTSAEFEGRGELSRKALGMSRAQQLEVDSACDEFWRARGVEPRGYDWKNNRINF